MVRPPARLVLPLLPALAGGVDVVGLALDCGCGGDPLPAVDAHAVIAHATANVLTAATRWREFIEPTLRGSLSLVSSHRRVANLTGMELTHVDERGAARMVDVSAKDVTAREAVATGRLVTTAEVIGLLRRDGLPKGDALAVARVAGIAGAKRTSDLVPLCHPIALHGVTVDLELTDEAVEIVATTRTADRTGVEMEALPAVVVAGLALYDMVKAVDRSATLTDVRLLSKSGGRSGEWQRDPQ
jgi:cyclic pyranopterin phosphate synthase